jgi:hypothetical protein
MSTAVITCIRRRIEGIETDPTVVAEFELRLPAEEADTIVVGQRYTVDLDPIGSEEA